MRRLAFLSWAVPLALAAWLLSHNIRGPWTGSYDANGARESVVARNHLRYGLLTTRGGLVVSGGYVEPSEFRYYTHHPSGLSLTIAGSFALFGVHEWSARLVPIAFTLGSVVMLYLVARELGGPWAGFFAALVYVCQPMVAFYGRMPDHEPPTAFFALALTLLYLHWQRDERKPWLAAMCVVAFVAVCYAWLGFVMPWLLLAYHWLVKRRSWGWLALPCAAAVLGFLTVLGHIFIVVGGLEDLGRALAYRLGSRASDWDEFARFGPLDYVARQGVYFWTAFTLVALAAGLAWALGLGRRAKAEALLVAALAGFSLVNLLVLRQGAYIHIYYQFHLSIPLAVSAGLALAGLRKRPAQDRGLAALAIGVMALIAFEGWEKLTLIRQAVFDEDQIAVASRVRDATRPEDRILVIWDRRSSFHQLTYYADRNITAVRDQAEAQRLLAREDFSILVVVGVGPSGVEITKAPSSAPARPPSR